MKHNTLAYILVALGLIQSLGWATKQEWLRGIGLLTVASPLPIVFTQVKGIETFAEDFNLNYTDDKGNQNTLKIDSKSYSQFKAPYNFRNVIGAAVSYGPILPPELRDSVLHYAFVSPGNLVRSLDLEPPLKNASLTITSRTAGNDQTWEIQIPSKFE